MAPGEKLCALCHRSYVNLKQHLEVSHSILNKEEFALLRKYGNARTTEPLDCPICSKERLVRLDKHLQDVHRMMTYMERVPLVKQAKKLAIVREFSELRKRKPYPPMVSNLGNVSDHDDQEVLDVRPKSSSSRRISTSVPAAAAADQGQLDAPDEDGGGEESYSQKEEKKEMVIAVKEEEVGAAIATPKKRTLDPLANNDCKCAKVLIRLDNLESQINRLTSLLLSVGRQSVLQGTVDPRQSGNRGALQRTLQSKEEQVAKLGKKGALYSRWFSCVFWGGVL